MADKGVLHGSRYRQRMVYIASTQLLIHYLFVLRVLFFVMSLSPKELHYQQDHINGNVQPNIYAACFVCLPAAFIAVGLRLISRRMTVGGFGKDDVAILFALVCTSAFVAFCI